MKIKRKFLLCIIMIIFCLSLTGCIPGDGTNSVENTAGFFSGIWHGWIAPFSLIGSILNEDLSIYEIYNNGFLYDLGFYMAIISGFGGLALSRKKKKRDDSNE